MPALSVALEEIRQLAPAHKQAIPPEFLDENRHVNVQYYLRLAESGLGAVFQRAGLSQAYASAVQIGNFALEQHIRYLAEILLDDRVSVHIRLLELHAKRAYFIGFLVNDTRGELAATVETVMMNVDIQRRRGVAFPPDAHAWLEALWTRHQQLPWEAPVCGVMRA